MQKLISQENKYSLIESYEDYKNNQYSLKAQIDRLKEETERLANLQRKRVLLHFSRIQYYALELLKGDGAYEEKFQKMDNLYKQILKIHFILMDVIGFHEFHGIIKKTVFVLQSFLLHWNQTILDILNLYYATILRIKEWLKHAV